MTDLDAGLVRRKLVAITRALDDLAPVQGLSLTEYRRDRFRQKATERLLQEVVDAAADVNAHLLRAAGAPPPSDYYTSFVEVGRRGVLPADLAERLAPSAGLRNRLVHEYDEIDDAIVLAAVATARLQFAEFVRVIEVYLTNAGL